MPPVQTKFVTRNGRKFKVPIDAPEPPRLLPEQDEAAPVKRLVPEPVEEAPTEIPAGEAAPVLPPRLSELPTEDRKVVEISEEGADVERSDDELERDIFIKRAKGETLTDEELGFLFTQSKQPPEVDMTPFEELQAGIEGRITGLETEQEQRKKEQLTEREKLVGEKEKELEKEFGIKRERERETGRRISTAAQDVLSFSGFGRSTVAAEKQTNIQKETEDRIRILDSQQELKKELFRRQLEGQDEESLQPLSDRINAMKTQSDQLQLDSLAKIAELNAENSVRGEEAINNLLEAFGPGEARTVDKNASELLGFVSDQFGNPIGDPNNPIPVNIEEDKQWDTYVDPFTGKTIFYNKNDPTETIGAPGSTNRGFEQPDGSVGSAQTSDSSDLTIIGQGDEYTRDNGTQGLLGENCVKYARTKVTNLPTGLNNKQDKIRAIREEGNTDMSQVQIGDAVLSGEGNWGHAFIVEDIDPNTGELIIDEANYRSGQVTSGRRIDPNDPVIYGFVSGIIGPAQQISDAPNEGENAGIDAQVLATTVEDVEFSKGEKAGFRQYLKDGSIPSTLKFPAQQIEFKQNAEIFGAQIDRAFAEGGLTEIMAASEGGSNPSDSFKNSWNKAVSVGTQLGSLVNLINEGQGTDPNTGESIDWSPITGWMGEKFPWAIKSQRMKAMLTSIVPNLARGIFGEVGVLTDNDVKIYMQTIPNLRQVKDVQKAVTSATLTLVRNSMANQLRTQAQAGVDVSRFVSNWNTVNDELNKINAELGIKQEGEAGGGDEIDDFLDTISE